jgi:hypothetical protein
MLNTNNRAAGSSDPLGPDCREEAMARTGIQELILQELEGLAEDRILEVLDFIRFLKSRQGEHPPLPGRRLIPQPEALRILAELDRIRAEVEGSLRRLFGRSGAGGSRSPRALDRGSLDHRPATCS